MPGNTNTSVQSNQTFYTTPVPIVVGVLNPANTPQTVWDCGVGMNYASMTTLVTGTPASFTIVLEGTYDGSTWATLVTTTNVAGETQFSTGLIPFTNLRARCSAVSGGTSPTVNVVVTASQTPLSATSGGTVPGNVNTSTSAIPNGVSPNGTIVSGSVAATSTLFSIAAGASWYGVIGVSTANNAAVTAAATVSVATPNTAGVQPQNTTLVSLTIGANVVGGTVGDSGSMTIGPLWVRNTTGGSINITATVTGGSSASAVASGVQYPV
jgi:hypothetical protein